MHSALVNIQGHIFFGRMIYFPLGVHPVMGLLGQMLVVFLRETGFHCVNQTGLELMNSSNPPA